MKILFHLWEACKFVHTSLHGVWCVHAKASHMTIQLHSWEARGFVQLSKLVLLYRGFSCCDQLRSWEHSGSSTLLYIEFGTSMQRLCPWWFNFFHGRHIGSSMLLCMKFVASMQRLLPWKFNFVYRRHAGSSMLPCMKFSVSMYVRTASLHGVWCVHTEASPMVIQLCWWEDTC